MTPQWTAAIEIAEPMRPAQLQEEEGGSHSGAGPADELPESSANRTGSNPTQNNFSLTPAEEARISAPSLLTVAAAQSPDEAPPISRVVSARHAGDDSLGMPTDMVAASEAAPVPGVSAPADLIGADEERRAKLQALALELPKSSVTKEAALLLAAVDPRFHPTSRPGRVRLQAMIRQLALSRHQPPEP